MVSLLHLTLRCRMPSLQLFALHPTLTPSRMRAIAVVAHKSISMSLGVVRRRAELANSCPKAARGFRERILESRRIGELLQTAATGEHRAATRDASALAEDARTALAGNHGVAVRWRFLRRPPVQRQRWGNAASEAACEAQAAHRHLHSRPSAFGKDAATI